MAKTDSTNSRAAVLFEEIAGLADSADKLMYSAECDDLDACYKLAHQLRDTLCRVGWLADKGSEDTGGSVIRWGAEAWMLPPAYHGVAYEVEVAE